MRSTIVAIAILSILDRGWCLYQRVNDNTDFQLDPKVENALFRELRRECPNCPESGTGDKKSRKIFDKVDPETKAAVPFSQERLEKMMHKAIIKIITGDLSYADVLLLKSLNYSLEQVLAIRLMELRKRKKSPSPEPEPESVVVPMTQPPVPEMRESSSGRLLDYEDFNKKAVNDYEEMASELQRQSEEKREHRDFDKAMESHVVFKIRYDDSEFDSSDSDERSDENLLTSGSQDLRGSSSFQAPDADLAATVSVAATTSGSTLGSPRLNSSEESTNSARKPSEYEGLEWVEDDVYRVIPEALNYDNDNDNWNNDENGNGSSSSGSGSSSGGIGNGSSSSSSSSYGLDYDENRSIGAENDTTDFQNDSPDSVQLFMANANNSDNYSSANLSSYRQRNWAYRQDGNGSSPFGSQGQKAIEDIKLRVLAMTGRFNLTSNISQIHRERLKMFSPTCQLPRNTDTEAWTDPLYMNMHFQLNLTSGEHVVTAKLRLYKLPQENVTVSGGTSAGIEEDEEDEKRIRISVYFYTKSLKKHRAKKRLMDSVVTPLTTTGSRLALDVRQALRYWRSNNSPRNTGNHNHGLVVEVEDQDGKSLKPALYIHPPSCQSGSTASSTEPDQDEKTSTSPRFSSEPVLVTYAS